MLMLRILTICIVLTHVVAAQWSAVPGPYTGSCLQVINGDSGILYYLDESGSTYGRNGLQNEWVLIADLPNTTATSKIDRVGENGILGISDRLYYLNEPGEPWEGIPIGGDLLEERASDRISSIAAASKNCIVVEVDSKLWTKHEQQDEWDSTGVDTHSREKRDYLDCRGGLFCYFGRDRIAVSTDNAKTWTTERLNIEDYAWELDLGQRMLFATDSKVLSARSGSVYSYDFDTGSIQKVLVYPGEAKTSTIANGAQGEILVTYMSIGRSYFNVYSTYDGGVTWDSVAVKRVSSEPIASYGIDGKYLYFRTYRKSCERVEWRTAEEEYDMLGIERLSATRVAGNGESMAVASEDEVFRYCIDKPKWELISEELGFSWTGLLVDRSSTVISGTVRELLTMECDEASWDGRVMKIIKRISLSYEDSIVLIVGETWLDGSTIGHLNIYSNDVEWLNLDRYVLVGEREDTLVTVSADYDKYWKIYTDSNPVDSGRVYDDYHIPVEVIVGADGCIYICQDRSILISTDKGENWTSFQLPHDSRVVGAMLLAEKAILLNCSDRLTLFWTGSNCFSACTMPGNVETVLSMSVAGDQVLLGTQYYGIYTSEISDLVGERVNAVQDLSFNIYPNPSNEGISVVYDGVLECGRDAYICDTSGRIVWKFADGAKNFMRWDGRDKSGLDVSSGVYFFFVPGSYARACRFVLNH